jgi:hypothetical protein
MFRRPLYQLINKRGLSNDTCKIDKTESMLKNIFILCISNSLGISVLLLAKNK